MKYLFVLLSFAIMMLSSCSYEKESCTLTKEDIRMMHLVIERARPDTVAKYLDHFIGKYHLPTTARGIPDGIYSFTSPYDDFDYHHTAVLEIKDGEIIAFDYDEKGKDGHSKMDDPGYGEKMNESVQGSAPSLVYPVYMQQVLDKQDLNGVDAVGGATYSLYRMKFAAILALSGEGEIR